VAFVSIELVGAEVGGEVEIGEAVAIDITNRYAGAIVVVEVVEDVEVGLLGENVLERDPGSFWRQELEQLGWRRFSATLASCKREEESKTAKAHYTPLAADSRWAASYPLHCRRDMSRSPVGNGYSEFVRQADLSRLLAAAG